MSTQEDAAGAIHLPSSGPYSYRDEGSKLARERAATVQRIGIMVGSVGAEATIAAVRDALDERDGLKAELDEAYAVIGEGGGRMGLVNWVTRAKPVFYAADRAATRDIEIERLTAELRDAKALLEAVPADAASAARTIADLKDLVAMHAQISGDAVAERDRTAARAAAEIAEHNRRCRQAIGDRDKAEYERTCAERQALAAQERADQFRADRDRYRAALVKAGQLAR